mmetsp:Transcript_13432/g.36158  ORF Transcript_13432/g.36158 Transcript_13432/m.36158 type:complete len:249 (-) Transcript_13432:340-1086(-)
MSPAGLMLWSHKSQMIGGRSIMCSTMPGRTGIDSCRTQRRTRSKTETRSNRPPHTHLGSSFPADRRKPRHPLLVAKRSSLGCITASRESANHSSPTRVWTKRKSTSRSSLGTPCTRRWTSANKSPTDFMRQMPTAGTSTNSSDPLAAMHNTRKWEYWQALRSVSNCTGNASLYRSSSRICIGRACLWSRSCQSSYCQVTAVSLARRANENTAQPRAASRPTRNSLRHDGQRGTPFVAMLAASARSQHE